MACKELEVGRYRKRKESNTSKVQAKSKHKHQYTIVYLKEQKKHTCCVVKTKACTICGKIAHTKREYLSKPGKFFYQWSDEEIAAQHLDGAVAEADLYTDRIDPKEMAG